MTSTNKTNEVLDIPLLRISRKAFEKLPKNNWLKYEAFFKINDSGVIDVNKQYVDNTPRIQLPGFKSSEKPDNKEEL